MCKNYQRRHFSVGRLAVLLLAFLIAFSTATLSRSAWANDVAVGRAPIGSAKDANTKRAVPTDDLVYWKQYVFSIPYHVNRKAADPDAPAEVRLLLSIDRGQKWAEISRVRPDVRGFTYYAPRDGEYWFSLQTIDRQGNIWPADKEKQTLRVVVDTHPPKLLIWVDTTPSGSIAVSWQTSDEHPRPSSLQIEMQTDADAAWRVVELQPSVSVASHIVPDATAALGPSAAADRESLEPDRNPNAGRVLVQASPGAGKVRFRATVADRAGNLSETSAEVSVADRPERTAMLPGRRLANAVKPGGSDRQIRSGAVTQSVSPTAIGPAGHASESRSWLFTPPSKTLPNSTERVGQTGVEPSEIGTDRFPLDRSRGGNRSAPSEPWPVDEIVVDRTGAADPSKSTQPVAISINNPYVRARPTSADRPTESQGRRKESGQTGAVAPPVLSPPPKVSRDAPPINVRIAAREQMTGNRPIGVSEQRPTWQTLPTSGQPILATVNNDRPAIVYPPASTPPPMPGRQSVRSQGVESLPAQSLPAKSLPSQRRQPIRRSSVANGGAQNPTAPMVNSRSFSIEYEVQSVGSRGVGRVELWGTTDRGATWRRYGTDPDHRSPMEVAVEGEGEYGFRIIVHAAGSYGAIPPHAGDAPDVWVGVDLKTPTVSIGSVQKGRGNQADQLTVRWTAEDEYLAPNPISLLFAAHPAGPWTTIATRLDNTGYYTWRLGDYVPKHLFLRVEARDVAGNVGAYSTAEPVVFERHSPTGRIQGVRVN